MTRKKVSTLSKSDKFVVKDIGFYLLMILSVAIIIWPFFFITELRQYPDCIAFDLFPVSNGYPSDRLESFLFFIQLPSALLGIFLLSTLTSLVRRRSIVWRYVLIWAIRYGIVVFVLGLLLIFLGFDMSTDMCVDYKSNSLPDLNLIIK